MSSFRLSRSTQSQHSGMTLVKIIAERCRYGNGALIVRRSLQDDQSWTTGYGNKWRIVSYAMVKNMKSIPCFVPGVLLDRDVLYERCIDIDATVAKLTNEPKLIHWGPPSLLFWSRYRKTYVTIVCYMKRSGSLSESGKFCNMGSLWA